MIPSRLRRPFRVPRAVPPPPPQAEPQHDYAETTFPSVLEHVRSTIRHLRAAFHEDLPDEILKQILFEADYDAIHYTATSSQETIRYGRHSGTKESDPIAHVETEPLKYLDESPEGGRIRNVRIQATSRDQGWVSNNHTASWSWLEVRVRTETASEETWSGFTWARNRVGDGHWQYHELKYHVDDDNQDEQLRSWVHGLQNGQRVSIVPMAKYGGWQCSMQSASIDIEVEVWR